jgi:hypothetical protein
LDRVWAGERDWLLARLAEKPDLTLRAVVAELVERGVPASYGAVWRLLKAEGITVKKACSPPNRIAPTWPAGGSGGSYFPTQDIDELRQLINSAIPEKLIRSYQLSLSQQLRI